MTLHRITSSNCNIWYKKFIRIKNTHICVFLVKTNIINNNLQPKFIEGFYNSYIYQLHVCVPW